MFFFENPSIFHNLNNIQPKNNLDREDQEL